MADAPHVDPMPLSVLLTRVAAELHMLCHDGRAVEDAIGRAILGEEPSTGQTLANLQRVDLIVQTLGQLGDYLGAVTGILEPDQVIDVNAPLSRINLRDLARNLAGGCLRPVLDENGRISGEVDLF